MLPISSSLSAQNQQRLSGITSTITNSQEATQVSDDSVIAESLSNNNAILDAEITDSNLSNDNTEIVAKLAQLKQLRDVDLITEELYKAQVEKIFESDF